MGLLARHPRLHLHGQAGQSDDIGKDGCSLVLASCLVGLVLRVGSWLVCQTLQT